MTGELADIDERSSGHKLLGDKGVSEVVNFGALDTREDEEAVDAASDVSDEKRVSGFGDKDVFGSTFGSNV